MKQPMIVFFCQREEQLTAVCNLQLKALSELNCTSESSGERSVSELDQLELVQLNYLSYYLLIKSYVGGRSWRCFTDSRNSPTSFFSYNGTLFGCLLDRF